MMGQGGGPHTFGQATAALAERERVEALLSQLDKLPVLPSVAARLLTVTGSPDSSTADVVHLLESDVALSASVLRLAARADLGVSLKGLTVAKAVGLLGFARIRNAVLAQQLFQLFQSAQYSTGVLGEFQIGLWKHSLAVACAAEMLAEKVMKARCGDLFVCGLLHDFGKLALMACLPKSYARVLERVRRLSAPILEAERSVLGIDHTAAGRRLAQRWRLADVVVNSAWMHHLEPRAIPASVSGREELAIVFLADGLARQLRLGFSGSPLTHGLEPFAEAIGVKSSDLNAVAAALPQRMGPYLELIGVDEQPSSTVFVQSLSDAARELGAINTQLAEAGRRLAVQSACFRALSLVGEAGVQGTGLTDVCKALARGAAALLGIEYAMVFVENRGTNLIYVADSAARDPRFTVFDSSDSTWSELHEMLTSSTDSHLGSAPESALAHWNQFGQEPGGDPLWCFRFGATQCWGLALMAAPRGGVAPLRGAVDECAVVAAAFAAAAARAVQCAACERMAEELVDLHRQLASAQEQFVRNRSLGMMEQMAAGAAHEINNPLAVIRGRAQMALAAGTDSELTRTFQIIDEQSRRASEIVDDLMRFARPSSPAPRSLVVAELLDRLAAQWYQRFAMDATAFEISTAFPDLAVFADPAHLEEILGAVVENAVQAATSKGIHIKINSIPGPSDERVRIVVADDGIGMSRDVLEHAFDPFYSNLPAGRRRGMGLSNANRLTSINGGELMVESVPNRGTSVTIELPTGVPSANTHE